LFNARLVTAAVGVGAEDGGDLVADAAEDGELLLVGAFGVGGIVERPMVAIQLTGENRADLIGLAADGDDGLDISPEKFIEMLRAMRRDVDARLVHRLDSEWMHVARGLRSGAGDIDQVAGEFAQPAFGEMTAARIARAEDEDERFVRHDFSELEKFQAPCVAGRAQQPSD
jgi:hypothetical protein